MKVGDYVRDHTNGIGRVIKCYNNELEIVFNKATIKTTGSSYFEFNLNKSSPNIIDLIEVGDYVNGSLVEFSGTITWDKDMKPITKAIKVKQGGYDAFLNNENIKSIVTHEQFSQMEYRIGE